MVILTDLPTLDRLHSGQLIAYFSSIFNLSIFTMNLWWRLLLAGNHNTVAVRKPDKRIPHLYSIKLPKFWYSKVVKKTLPVKYVCWWMISDSCNKKGIFFSDTWPRWEIFNIYSAPHACVRILPHTLYTQWPVYVPQYASCASPRISECCPELNPFYSLLKHAWNRQRQAPPANLLLMCTNLKCSSTYWTISTRAVWQSGLWAPAEMHSVWNKKTLLSCHEKYIPNTAVKIGVNLNSDLRERAKRSALLTRWYFKIENQER